MTQNNRPLSPHLQVYKLPLTGIISITHRMTGVILAFGLIAYVISFFLIMQGNTAYMDMQALLEHPASRIVLWFFIYSLFFHMCHGIRHLIWDVGAGFEKETMDRNAIIELVLSLVLTIIFY